MLIEHIQNEKVKPENLSWRERRQIVKHFLEEQSEVSNAQIGALIGTSGQHVGRVKKSLLKEASSEIDELDIKLLATSMKKRKEEYQRKAAKREDYSLAWKIEMDFIEKMQSFGFVHKEAEAVAHINALSIIQYRESKRLYKKENGKTK